MDEKLNEALGVLKERRNWLTARIVAKWTVNWDVEWDRRERDALNVVLAWCDSDGSA